MAWESVGGAIGYQCERCAPEVVGNELAKRIKSVEVERRLNSLRRSMLIVAMKLTSNRDDAEDAVGQAYLDLLKNPPEEWGFNFLTTLVVRRITDILRRTKPSTSLSAIPEESHIFAIEEDITLPDAELERIVKDLPLHERILINAVAESDEGLAGAAESLGVSEQALKSELHRVRRKIAGKSKEREEAVLF